MYNVSAIRAKSRYWKTGGVSNGANKTVRGIRLCADVICISNTGINWRVGGGS